MKDLKDRLFIAREFLNAKKFGVLPKGRYFTLLSQGLHITNISFKCLLKKVVERILR